MGERLGRSERRAPAVEHDAAGRVVAVVGPPVESFFAVQFIGDLPDDVLSDVRRELDYYLVDLPRDGEPNPWAYAQYHCGQIGNVYGSVHWGFSPGGESEAERWRSWSQDPWRPLRFEGRVLSLSACSGTDLPLSPLIKRLPLHLSGATLTEPALPDRERELTFQLQEGSPPRGRTRGPRDRLSSRFDLRWNPEEVPAVRAPSGSAVELTTSTATNGSPSILIRVRQSVP